MIPLLSVSWSIVACTPAPGTGGGASSDQGYGEVADDGADADGDGGDGTGGDDADTAAGDDDTAEPGDDTGREPLRCNGHAALCDLRLDQVTLAGTHNSMSNADDGWWLPNQQHGISEQLDAGVRALMLDTHDYWGEPQLCHNWCELGRQPLAEGLGELAAFLDDNPSEVVVLIIQDGISAEVTAEVFEEVGLLPRLWVRDPERGALPTLGELVAAGTQLVVSAENAGPPPDWYHHAWDLFVDTPYSFGRVEDFSCETNRGAADNPLLLVNHWLSVPGATREGSREANAAPVLEARARQCERELGRRVNVLAVDFYDVGDLFVVVDNLNGEGVADGVSTLSP